MPRTYLPNEEPAPGYRLIEFLGRGGFGEVWKASAPGGTLVALKMIDLSGREGQKELRALRMVKRVRHPNLVPITAFWLRDQNGELFDEEAAVGGGSPEEETMFLDVRQPQEMILAMGLGDKNLYDRLKECRKEGMSGIPANELLDYMEDAARAIDHLNSALHDWGSGPIAIQHCDIKPQNIMIVSGGAQVCDFGLARAMGDVRVSTAAGSPAYAAPECIQDNQPSQGTDQYSLAISYIELRTGRLPFEEVSFMAVLKAHMLGELDLSLLPDAERAVIKKGTSRDPKFRYPTSIAMVRDLRKAVHGELQASQVDMSPSAPRDSQNWTMLGSDGRNSGSLGDAATQVWEAVPAKMSFEQEGGRRTSITLDPSATAVFAPAVEAAPPAKKSPALLMAGGGGAIVVLAVLAFWLVRGWGPTPWLPPGYEGAPDAVVVALPQGAFYDRIVRTGAGSDTAFRLMKKVRPDDPESFYMMEQKVSNGLFGEFAKAHPEQLAKETEWTLGASNSAGDLKNDIPRLPVFRMTVDEAHRCCAWLGGRLPDTRQWDKAAGLFDHPELSGPFDPAWKPGDKLGIGVNRGEEGPLEIGAAKDDKSPMGCFDMAGNGAEWTRDIAGIEGRKVPLEKPTSLDNVLWRGQSYNKPAPLKFAELRDPEMATIESGEYLKAYPSTSFRTVIELPVDGK